MTLRDVKIASLYNSMLSDIDVLTDFYSPVLEEANRYDRVAGYFSSSVFASAARGIAGLVRNGGKMRLVTSHAFTPGDITKLQDFFDSKELENVLIEQFTSSYQKLGSLQSTIEKHHVAAMCWMLREGFLEIKVVIPDSADLADANPEDFEKFHPKFGIIYDVDGNSVAFHGSVNETAGAWQRNMENFVVFKSWIPGMGEFINPSVSDFEKMWSGSVSKGWRTIDLPAAVKEKIIRDFAPVEFPKEIENLNKENHLGLREYQIHAVNSWINNDHKGILEMATGTGKTRTAKACITNAINLGTCLTIVVVPYQHIGDQWERELLDFEPVVIGANWRKKIEEFSNLASMGRIENLTLIAVQNTAGNSDFVALINDLRKSFKNFLLVGDEVHWLGANAFSGALMDEANLRLGLSATPQRYFDEEGTEKLIDYFGGTVYQLTIGDALSIQDESGKNILCPYEYHPILVDLSESELNQYREISKKIAQYKSMEDQYDMRVQLNIQYTKRAAISKSAASKIPAVRELLTTLEKPLKNCLIYCADKNQLMEVAKLLHEQNIDFQQITGEESTVPSDKFNGMNEREFIIHNFSIGQLGVLLAIRCLDEGVDIPSASIGIILASSGNTKEFIQRRGRLMRPFLNKEKATIYDFCVLPDTPDSEIRELSIIQVELKRVIEFGEDALNRSQVYDLVQSFES